MQTMVASTFAFSAAMSSAFWRLASTLFQCRSKSHCMSAAAAAAQYSPFSTASTSSPLAASPSSPSALSPQNKVKREEKWRQVVHSLLRWMRTRKVWAALGQELKTLSGLKMMDNKKWLEWALGDK